MAGSNLILRELDAARSQRFHLKTIVIAGMGFFSDAYDLFVISLVLPILAILYGTSGKLAPLELSAIAASALFGAVLGQVVFGFLADRLGRKRVYAITLSVMAIGAVGSAFSAPFGMLNTVMVLVLWRFVLGFGVGGDYPLSATIMSEYSNVRNRGRLVASVFAMQGFGILLGAIITLGALFAFPATTAGLNLVWRAVLGLGAVPALATIYFRTKMPETPRFTLAVKGDAQGAADAVAHLTGKKVENTISPARRARVGLRRFLTSYAPVLFGTAAAWFLLDVAFYFQNIFNPIVLQNIGYVTSGVGAHQLVLNLAEGNILIALFATIPGYWAAVALIDRWGRRSLQILGFGVMALSFGLLALFYSELLAASLALFIVIYATTFFFANMGPNTTTFVLPSEVYPTRFRATGHGISAASGKMGAAIATFFLPFLFFTNGVLHPEYFWLLAGVCFLGFVISLILTPETAGRTLEDVSREDELEIVVERFSPHLVSLTSCLKAGATELKALLDDPGAESATRVPKIRTIEHDADERVHRIYVEINNKRMRTAVRSDIGALASSLDDIMDGIEGVSARVVTYHLERGNPELSKFAAIVVACVDGVSEGIDSLDDLLDGKTERIQRVIVEVNRLENEADDLLRVLLSRLFEDRPDPVEVIKLKDFYERLEVITDRCEDVTDVYKDLIARYALLPTRD